MSGLDSYGRTPSSFQSTDRLSVDPSLYRRLAQRIGRDHLDRRLQIQARSGVKLYTIGGYALLPLRNAQRFHALLKLFFRSTGLFRRGQVNCLDYRLEQVRLHLQGLPAAFQGFRILQLSDLHADGIPDAGVMLTSLLQSMDCDLCVITGDYRFDTHSEYLAAMTTTAKIVAAVRSKFGVVGVLGNHDDVAFVPELENMGLRVLLNESIRIEKDGQSLLLAGVDDPHMYKCHDLDKALSARRDRETALLLAHTPEIYAQAERAGIEYLLCGHTHGGQVCLPWNIPIISNASSPRRYCRGLWRYRGMWGYTSRGTGSSGLAVRYCCPPEITLHILNLRS